MRRVLLLLPFFACATTPRAPVGTPLELGLAGTAKLLCSAVFVSGRDAGEAWEHSATALMPDAERDAGFGYRIEGSTVTVGVPGGPERRAQFHGDQGCIIGDRLHFSPEPVAKQLPPESSSWPLGNDTQAQPFELDAAKLTAAADAAFEDPAGLTAAFIVLHQGRIVIERYGAGAHAAMPLESWSMGKSITATLLGLLVKDGVLHVDDPAPVPQWQGDERKAIRVKDLLQMSSGLDFRASFDPDFDPTKGYADHVFIYTGGVDAFAYSLQRPLAAPPGTRGRYHNCDPLTVGWLVKQAVEARGESYRQYPQRALFDRLGMRHMVLETDPYGNFLLTGYDYGAARDWARLGQLYLQDGVWQGERLLPEGWSTLVSTPAPGWSKPEYGGFFWLNRTRDWPLPDDAYSMVGSGNQRVFVVPSRQLVLVRMGHSAGAPASKEPLKKAMRLLLEAIPDVDTGRAP